MTNEIMNELRVKLEEYVEHQIILKSLENEISELAFEIDKKIISILDYDGQVSYDPINNKIHLFQYNNSDKPITSDLIKIQELLKADDSDFTPGNKEAIIKVFYN